MAITNWPLGERPRERLLRDGATALSDAELLAIFLRTGVKGKTAVDLARELLLQFKGLRHLLEASQTEFCAYPGLGLAKYAQLQAVLEMNRRYLHTRLVNNNALTNSIDTQRFLISRLRHYQHEVFACLFLDNHYRVIQFEELFHGTLNYTNVYPREIIKRALHYNAAAVICAHNHPSGIADASEEDKQLTQQLMQALALVNIKLLDHVIVGDGQVCSLAEFGLLGNIP